jgi:DedD protein
VSGASEVGARRVRRASTRRERFWLAIDRRVIAGAVGVVLLIGGLVFLAGIGVGKALAPLVPEEPQPALAVAPAPAPGPEQKPTPVRAPAVVEPARTPEPKVVVPVPSSAVTPPAPPSPVRTPASTPSANPGASPEALKIVRQAPRSGYGLQLGAFETEAQALAFVADHQQALAPVVVHVLASEIPKKGTWYRVRVGLYQEKASAQRALSRLGPELEKSAIVVSYR